MNINLLLEILKYTLFSTFLFSGAFFFYKGITPKEIQESHRLRFKEQLNSKQKQLEKRIENTSFEQKLKEAGLTFVTTYRFEMIRIGILILLFINYWIIPLLSGKGIVIQSISLIIVLWLLTEYRYKIPVSLTNLLINALIRQKKRARSIELFTLYDVLKTELKSLSGNQNVNVYNLLKDSLSMFKYIKGTLSRLLSTILTNPKLAERVLYEDIKTPASKTLGEIIVKIDNLTRDEALEIIETESKAYSNHFFKEEFRSGQKRKNRLQVFFSCSVLLNAAWLVIFITNMLLIQLQNVNQIF